MMRCFLCLVLGLLTSCATKPSPLPSRYAYVLCDVEGKPTSEEVCNRTAGCRCIYYERDGDEK